MLEGLQMWFLQSPSVIVDLNAAFLIQSQLYSGPLKPTELYLLDHFRGVKSQSLKVAFEPFLV